MNLLAPIRSWWKAIVRHNEADDEVEAELAFHLERRTEELSASGVSPDEALRRAKAELGRVDVQKERYRSAIGLQLFYEIGGDLRYGFRSLLRHPSVSVVAVLSLGLGIGATTAMFSTIYNTLLHPFPYADADRIVNPAAVDEKHPQTPTWFALTPPQYASFLKAKSIDSVLGFLLGGGTETGGELPGNIQIAYVSSNISSFLGIPVLMGRNILPSDTAVTAKQTNVVVLNYKFWEQRYNHDRGVIGRVLQLDHEDYTIVGVMPPRFTFTETVGNVDVYIPWTPGRTIALFPWIKLKPGVTPAAASAEFQSFLNTFKRETPDHFPKEFHVRVQPIIEPYLHRAGRTLALLFVSVMFLMIVGCANCSILLLARGEARQHELAIRSAIGASRFRMVRQLLLESLAISAAGAVLGTAMSYWLAKLPMKLMPDAFPQEAAITINLPVLGFSIGMALLTGVLAGLYPALRFSRPDVSQMIQSSNRSSGRVSRKRFLNLLIGGQIALAFLLLAVAGAAIVGFLHITSTNLGYDPHNVMALGIPLKQDRDKNQPKRANYIEQMRERVAATPGVLSVAVAPRGIPPSPPFGGFGTLMPVEILGVAADAQHEAIVTLISPEYFATLKIPLQQGRLWSPEENRRGDFVAVVNQSFAERFLSTTGAIGHQVRAENLKEDGKPLSAASPQSGEWREVIGVVADSRNDGLERPPAPAIYVPYTTFMWDSTMLLVRTAGNPLAYVHAIRTSLRSVHPDQRAASVGEDLEGVLRHQPIWAQQRLFSVLFSFFAGLALVLSLVGIASTVSFATARRRTELGIRVAMGATRGHIVWIVARAMLSTALAGVMAGLTIYLLLQKPLQLWMPGGGSPAWMPGVVTAFLFTGAAVACLLPAGRAARLDPADTLRCE